MQTLRVIAKPMSLPIGSLHVEPEQHNAAGTPQIRKVDALVAAIPAPMNHRLAKTRRVRPLNSVQAEPLRGAVVLCPQLTLETRRYDLGVIAVPPPVVAGIKDIRPGRSPVVVVYCDDPADFFGLPRLRGGELVVSETWPACDDNDGASGPSSCGAGAADLGTVIGCFSIVTNPIASSSCAVPTGSGNRCRRVTLPNLELTKLARATTNTCSMFERRAGSRRPAFHQKLPLMNADGR